MRRPSGQQSLRRVAIFAVAGAGAICLSGCHEILRVTLGGKDPPVHVPPSPASADPDAAAGQRGGRAFSGSADGTLAGRIVIKHGFVTSTIRNARFTGDFTAKLTGPPAAGDQALGPLAAARWHGLFSATRNRANGKIRMSGLVLATFNDPTAGRACLRLKYKNARARKGKANRNKGASTLTILGGEGGARTLAGSASVRVRVARGGSMRLSGRVRTTNGQPRGFTSACTRLERQFGLQPL